MSSRDCDIYYIRGGGGGGRGGGGVPKEGSFAVKHGRAGGQGTTQRRGFHIRSRRRRRRRGLLFCQIDYTNSTQSQVVHVLMCVLRILPAADRAETLRGSAGFSAAIRCEVPERDRQTETETETEIHIDQQTHNTQHLSPPHTTPPPLTHNKPLKFRSVLEFPVSGRTHKSVKFGDYTTDTFVREVVEVVKSSACAAVGTQAV